MINYRASFYSVFQKDHVYKSDNALTEVWERVQRLSSESILKNKYTFNIHPDDKEKLIKYVTVRISQALEFRDASKYQTLLSKPLSLYYSMLNLMRATIAIKYEVESISRHGLCFKSDNNILETSALINNGTFNQYLEAKGYHDYINKIVTLKEAISNIIELGKEVETIEGVSIGFTPYYINAYQDGDIIARALDYKKDFEMYWKDDFPNIALDFEILEKTTLHYKNDIFKIENNIENYINSKFLTDLNHLTLNDACIWYQYNESEKKCLPRICYYHIAFFILSNIVRYEPDNIQSIITQKNELYWVLNRLLYLGERYYPQLVLSEIYDTPVYF